MAAQESLPPWTCDACCSDKRHELSAPQIMVNGEKYRLPVVVGGHQRMHERVAKPGRAWH